MFVIRDPRFPTVQVLYLELVLRVELLELREQIRLYEGLD